MRSIVKRILVTCAATTALALLLTMVLCALGNAMAPKWQVEPFTDHITLTTTNTAIQAVDPATGAVLKPRRRARTAPRKRISRSRWTAAKP